MIPSSTDLSWHTFTDPRPYVTVGAIAYDDSGLFPILRRSSNVRSARDAYSFPTGLHEVGKTVEEQLAVELREELNLELVPGKTNLVGAYESIRPDDPVEVKGWHWVILIYLARIKDLKTLKNMEPDKHDSIELVNVNNVLEVPRTWTPHLEDFIKRSLPKLITFFHDLRDPVESPVILVPGSLERRRLAA